MNERVALNQKEVFDYTMKNRVICAQARFDDPNDFGTKYLQWCGNESAAIPYIAIIPAGNADQPITFDGPVTKATILEALEKAGASKID